MEMSLSIYSPPLRLEEPDLPDNLSEQADRRLVERSKAGDGDAFARLYDSYSERVYGYISFHVPDQRAALDLAARVHEQARENIRCYEPERLPFGTWLYLIARRTVIEFSRSRGEAVSITEITSLSDKGLDAYDAFQPSNSG